MQCIALEDNKHAEDNVYYGAVIKTQEPLRQFTRGSRDERSTAPGGCRPLHQADRLEP